MRRWLAVAVTDHAAKGTAAGQKVDAPGYTVTNRSAGNHTDIIWTLDP